MKFVQKVFNRDLFDFCPLHLHTLKFRWTRSERAKFIRQIAEEIESVAEPLTQRFVEESGLPEMRANGERGRTVGQLRLFADLIED